MVALHSATAPEEKRAMEVAKVELWQCHWSQLKGGITSYLGQPQQRCDLHCGLVIRPFCGLFIERLYAFSDLPQAAWDRKLTCIIICGMIRMSARRIGCALASKSKRQSQRLWKNDEAWWTRIHGRISEHVLTAGPMNAYSRHVNYRPLPVWLIVYDGEVSITTRRSSRHI